MTVVFIQLTAAKNAIAKVAFELQSSHVYEKRSNELSMPLCSVCTILGCFSADKY